MAGDFLVSLQGGLVQGLSVGGENGLGNGVGGTALRLGGQLQQHFLGNAVRQETAGHGEPALGEGAGLVEGYDLGLRQGLQVIAALDQDALTGGTANTGEKAEGYGYHQGAGTGDDQEAQSAVDGLAPGHQTEQGRDHRHDSRRQTDDRRINPGEAGDELLAGGLFLGGVFHHFKNLAGGGLAEGLLYPNLQRAAEIDTARHDRLSGADVPGHGFTGEGRRVQLGRSHQHGAVQGDFFAGAHQDRLAHLYLGGLHFPALAVLQQIGVVGADVQQGGNGFAGGGHGLGLQVLAQAVQQKHHDALGYLADAHRADARDGHQEALAENIAAADVVDGFDHDLGGRDQKSHQEDRHGDPGGVGKEYFQQYAGSQQYRACREGQKLLFCFFGVLLMVVVMTAIAAIAVVVVVAAAVTEMMVVVVTTAMVVVMLVIVVMAAAMIVVMFMIMMMLVFMAVVVMMVLVLFVSVVVLMVMGMDMSGLLFFLFHWSSLHFFHDMVKGHGKDLSDMRVIQGVVDHPSLLAAPDDPGNLQKPQLVADGALGHAQQRRQVAHAHLLNVQRADDPGPGTVPEDLE